MIATTVLVPGPRSPEEVLALIAASLLLLVALNVLARSAVRRVVALAHKYLSGGSR